MKQKRSLALVLSIILCVMLAFPVSAAYPYLVDDSDILSGGEEDALLAELTELSTEHGVVIAVATVKTLNGRSIESYANDFYNKNYGSKTDGVMLLLAMNEREYYIVTKGFGKTAIPNSRIDYIAERFVSSLSDGEYFDGFMIYALLCEGHIEKARNGDPYTQSIPFSYFAVALIIAAALAFLVVTLMKGQLKSVRMQSMARGYIRDNSFILTKEKDRFLYRNVTRRPRPKDNGSSGGGGSGGSRGGGGGRF